MRSSFLVLGLCLLGLASTQLSAAEGGACDAKVVLTVSSGQYTLTCLLGNCPVPCLQANYDHQGTSYLSCYCDDAYPKIVCNAGRPNESGSTPKCVKPDCAEGYNCELKVEGTPDGEEPPTWKTYTCHCVEDTGGGGGG